MDAAQFRLAISRAVLLIVLFGFWEFASARHFMNPLLIGSPSGIAVYLWNELFVTGSLLMDLRWTLTGTLMAFVLGCSAGILVGMLFVMNPFVEKLIAPILMALNA